MKLRNVMISLVVALAAGCDTMEDDADGQMLSINNEPAYMLPGSAGFIDLGARIVSRGKVRVEITGTTKNGSLQDLGKGLLQYSPSENSTHDSFRFRVLSENSRVLGEDSIGIIIPSDTTSMPCGVYTRYDTAYNVTGPITVDVAANDISCMGDLTISVNVATARGTATVVGNKIHYVPNPGFADRDQVLYKAITADPSIPAGYGLLVIYGSNPDCVPLPANDLFYKPINDTTTMFMDVLANDALCDSTAEVLIALNPHYGTAFYDKSMRRIAYKNFANVNHDDTLNYAVCGGGECNNARVVVIRN